MQDRAASAKRASWRLSDRAGRPPAGGRGILQRGRSRRGILQRGRRRRRGGLGRQHDVVAVAEHKDLGCPPDDPLELHHRAHPQPKLPQEQMLNEVPGQAPGPERQMPIANWLEAQPPQLEYQDIRAEKIVAPILKKSGDTLIVLFPATEIQRPRRTDQQAPARLEHPPAAREPGIYVF